MGFEPRTLCIAYVAGQSLNMDLFKAEIGGQAGLGGTDVSLAIVLKLYID